MRLRYYCSVGYVGFVWKDLKPSDLTIGLQAQAQNLMVLICAKTFAQILHSTAPDTVYQQISHLGMF